MKKTFLLVLIFMSVSNLVWAFGFLDQQRNIDCHNDKIVFEYIKVSDDDLIGKFWTPNGSLISSFRKKAYGSTPEDTDFVFLDQDKNNGVFFLIMWTGNRSFSITSNDLYDWTAGTTFTGWILSEAPSLEDAYLERYLKSFKPEDYKMSCTLIKD